MTVSLWWAEVNVPAGDSVAQTQSVTAGGTSSGIAVDNPATGEVVGHVAVMSAEQVAAAVSRARRAQAGWARLGVRARAEMFARSRRWMLAHRQEITDSIVAENGKAEEDAIVEIVYCVSAFAYWAKHTRRLLAETKVRSLSPFILGRSMYTRREPVGVVGVIGPWNNPLINSFGDAIPRPCGRQHRRAQAFRVHPADCAAHGEDDLRVRLARGRVPGRDGRRRHGGQTCTSVERVYVEAPVYDKFVARLRERFEEVTWGRSAGLGSTDVGAMTFPPQMTVVRDHVRDAVDRGARVLAGGHAAPGPGRFFEPTLLVDVDHTMTCMREETFGPTLPVMKVPDAEEAVRLANDSQYGLQASIIGSDMTRARRAPRSSHAPVQSLVLPVHPAHGDRHVRQPPAFPEISSRTSTIT
jgi:acyl-CoA reductase-like NAD-dependent aldehyde dehydrogenase